MGLIDVFTSTSENFIQEDINCNFGIDLGGGLQPAQIYYCFLPWVKKLVTPGASAMNAYAGRISHILCEENRYFSRMAALVDTAEIESKFSPKSDASSLEFFISGLRGELIGLSRKLRNKPFVFIVKTMDDRAFVFGTLASPAYVSSFELVSGKKWDNDNGAALKLASNAIIYELTGTIPIPVPEVVGDFTTDFDVDFF